MYDLEKLDSAELQRTTRTVFLLTRDYNNTVPYVLGFLDMRACGVAERGVVASVRGSARIDRVV